MSEPEYTVNDVVVGRMITAAFGGSAVAAFLRSIGLINVAQLEELRTGLELSIANLPPGLLSDGARHIALQAASEFGEFRADIGLGQKPIRERL